MRRRRGLIVLAVTIVAITTVFVVVSKSSRHESPESAILEHFGLSPREYTLQGETIGRPAFWEPSASFGDAYGQWSQTVPRIGDSIPTWFAGREGVFVVVRRSDGSLVGTHWLLVGGKPRIRLCRDEKDRFCGITIKRVGGTWIMGAPETRGPLP